MYSVGIIGWTAHECAELDRLTRKQLTLYKAQHPHADIDRLYTCMSHKKGGRGLQSVAVVASLEKHSLSVYPTKSTEPIMAKVRNHLLPNVLADSGTISKSTIQLQHIDQWRGNALHGQWSKLMDELRADLFRWLQNAHLKPVIESLLVVAQDQALHTNWLGFHIMGFWKQLNILLQAVQLLLNPST